MDATQLGTLVSPVAADHGLELDRLELQTAGKRSIVRIFLDGDGPDGRGPSLDQIAEATRGISAALDNADVTKGRPYTLEVSSRGVGRPLTEARHFRRNLGRLVRLTLSEGDVTGRILAQDGDTVELDVDGTRRTIPLAGIGKALVQVELNRPVAGEDEEA
jgi:ribosome maturation factor RimP